MKKMQHVQKRNGDKTEITEVDGTLQSLAHRLQRVEFLRSNEQRGSLALARPVDRSHQRRAGLAHRHFMSRAVLRHNAEEKIGVAQAGPRNAASKLVTLCGFSCGFPFYLAVD